MKLVPDATVIGVSAEPNHQAHADAVELMNAVARSHTLVLDYADEILEEYQRNGGPWYQQWWIRILSRHPGPLRVTGIPNQSVQQRLEDARFDNDDHVYVGVYLSASSDLLAYDDSDFENAVIKALAIDARRLHDCVPLPAD